MNYFLLYLLIGVVLSYRLAAWDKGYRMRSMKTAPRCLARLVAVPAVVVLYAFTWPLYLYLWIRQPRSELE